MFGKYFDVDNLNQYIVAIVILVAVFLTYCVASYVIFKRKLNILSQIRKNGNVWISGTVISVGDGDGFKLMESAILCRNKEPFSIRLAAIDAPEVRCFNRPGQPFANESKEKLRELILDKKVTIKALAIDRYSRVVAMVFVKKGWFRKINVNLEMIKLGMACVYRSRFTSFDGLEDEFNREEKKAREKRTGIWSDPNFVFPQDYKKSNAT